MDNLKIEEIRDLLIQIGVPQKQQNDMCCYVFIALCDMAGKQSWTEATNPWMGVHDIILYLKGNDIKNYAENTRESIRKNCLQPFRDMAVIEDNKLPNNNKNYKYRITAEVLDLIQAYKTEEWATALKYYQKYNHVLVHSYQSEKELQKMPVRVNGHDLRFSPGKHNQLQKKVLEDFMPRFAKNGICLYVGDTDDRDKYKNKELLKELGFDITLSVMPDIVLYVPDKKWIYFIECVTSVGPVSEKRKNEFEKITENVDADNVYITAFRTLTAYKKHVQELAWDTEVWIAEMPEHMIHLNGDKFLGPHKK